MAFEKVRCSGKEGFGRNFGYRLGHIFVGILGLFSNVFIVDMHSESYDVVLEG